MPREKFLTVTTDTQEVASARQFVFLVKLRSSKRPSAIVTSLAETAFEGRNRSIYEIVQLT